jgi:hypothetical protein
MDRGVFVEPSPLTLDGYIKKWLESAARPRVQARTADGYEALLTAHIWHTNRGFFKKMTIVSPCK